MGDLREQYEYVTLDSTGNGEVQFVARKAATRYRIEKLTCEMDITTTGKVALFKNGGAFLSEMNVAPKMEAYGPEDLYTSEFIRCVVTAGMPSREVKFTFFFEIFGDLP